MNGKKEHAETTLTCTGCGKASPVERMAYRCVSCGGLLDLAAPLSYQPADVGRGPGIARYAATFPFQSDTKWISLGEGNTPLIPLERDGRRLYLKAEHQNPTGSFKDRGTAVLISMLAQEGVRAALEDSSGNAGASFAAYAARAGIAATVYVPEYASGPKKTQISAYGAKIVTVPGPRSAVTEAVEKEADKGSVYASHAYLPYGLAGMATIAYELVEQLGSAPQAVLMPVGQGSLLLGLQRGFQALVKAGVIDQLPKLIGVQAQACAPIWAVFHSGAAGLGWVQEGETVAEGIRILNPLRGDAILAAVEESGGTMLDVAEEQILPARDELARSGFYVEPTSAVVWAAMKQCLPDLEDPVVLILTGHGLKSVPPSS